MIFIYKDEMGMEEKTRKRKGNERKKSPFVFPPIPLQQYGGRLFSGVRERRKQAGPTLSGRGS